MNVGHEVSENSIFKVIIKNEVEQRNSLLEKTKTQKQIRPSLKDIGPQIMASAIVHCIVIPAGINMAYSTILNNGLRTETDIIEKLTDYQKSWIACLATISVPIGSCISGPLMDKFGRKKVCFISCVPCIISWILIIVADSIPMIYASRLISGLGSGLSTVALVYTVEISHPQIRPMLLCLNSIFVAFGILAVCTFGAFLNWRDMSIIFLILSCFTFCGLFFIPESPYWLLCFGNEKSMEKRMSLVEENLKKLNPRENIYKEECERIMEICEKQSSSKKPYNDLKNCFNYYVNELRTPKAYKPILILFTILALQQLSGAYVVIVYAISVFREIGGTFGGGLDEFGALVLLGVIRFVMSLLTAHLSKHYGRRPLCLISGIGMSFSMFFSAMYLFLTSSYGDSEFSETLSNQKWLLLVIVLFYVCTSSFGFIVIPWTLIGELLPTSIRGFFSGLIISFAYLVMSGVIMAYPFALKLMGAQAIFFFFSAISLLATGFVYFFLPETFGKSLTEIENYFSITKGNGQRRSINTKNISHF